MAAASPDLPVRNSSGLRSPSGDFWRSNADSYETGLYNSEGTGWLKLAAIAGIALLCLFWGYAVVVAEWNAVIIGVALIACVLILVDFRAGVILLVLLMPIASSQIFPHKMLGVMGLNPVNLLLAATLGSYLLHALLDKTIGGFIPRSLLLLYLVPFIAAGVMGYRHVGDIALYFVIGQYISFTDTFGYVRDLIVKPLLIVIFALLVAAAVSRMKSPEKLLGAFIASVWIMGLMVIVYFVTSGANFGQLARTSEREFLSPLGLHANELSRMYVIAYALLLYAWSESRDQALKFILLASIGIVVVALALTFSRSGFMGLILVSGLFLVSRRHIGSLLIGLTVAVACLYFVPDAIYERVTMGVGSGANAVSAGRIDRIWIPLIPDVLRSPIFGSGIGAMLWSDAVRAGQTLLVTHPHNAYLRTVLDMGLVGLTLLCIYFFHVWKSFRSLGAAADLMPSERGFYQGAAAALVAFMFMALADGSLTPAPEQAFLWLAIGMMYGERLRRSAS